MLAENRCYLLLIYVIFTDVFNNNTNNSVTSISPKSLQTKLRGASIPKSWSFSSFIDKFSCHNI